ncbi:hypothetical protein MMSR116_23740 [Methylobacterium mesophilicum SR1.6/6]|uniref:GTPase-associated system helical domain-containing protein n=1 Tax=Methylobacterium mesophilicum SR1.6/6 TaxID=908290 RepID=A0A6B9FUF4_9HYPH|nr:GTPase-associated system all-helical protein GASH [Methylobacterium mesophilicum]QGY04584.1 hypothetical protein MMSR116_23740 [Methylobacterium mesophilicum SR1.6/6]
MEAIKRLGVAYGKLGLSSDAALIGRRGEGVKAAAGALELAGIAPLVQAAFGIGAGEERFAFLTDFSGDPTFDVQLADREALLLAAAVAECEIENESEISPDLALAVVTSACGGLRSVPMNDQLLPVARRYLAQFQGQVAARPKQRAALQLPKTLSATVEAITSNPSSYGGSQPALVAAALNEANKYAEAVSAAALTGHQDLLRHVADLEQEMRTYWWVTGGWSDGSSKPFRQLQLPLAAVCAGKELADKYTGKLGLFAAPALIDLLLERGRPEPIGNVAMQEAVAMTNRNWRKAHFAVPSSGALAPLLPVSTAMGLAAGSDDAEDWKPRFTRATGIEPDAHLPGTEFAVQLYRERLVARALR